MLCPLEWLQGNKPGRQSPQGILDFGWDRISGQWGPAVVSHLAGSEPSQPGWLGLPGPPQGRLVACCLGLHDQLLQIGRSASSGGKGMGEVSSNFSSLLRFAARARVSLAPESRAMAGRRAGVCPARGHSGVREGIKCPVSLRPSGALWRLMTIGNAMEPRPRGREEHPSVFPRGRCSFGASGFRWSMSLVSCSSSLLSCKGLPLRKGRLNEWGVGKPRPPWS